MQAFWLVLLLSSSSSFSSSSSSCSSSSCSSSSSREWEWWFCFASKPVICTVGQRIIYVARIGSVVSFYAVIGEKGVDLWKRGVELPMLIRTSSWIVTAFGIFSKISTFFE